MKSVLFTRTSLIAALVALPLGAFAQGPAAPANPADTSGAAATNAMPGAAETQMGRQESRVEQRIQNLHARLKISPQQEAQWDQFAQIMRDNARDMDQSFEQRAQRVEQMSAVDNMQSYAQIAQEHAQDVQKLVPAFQTLYNSFSPEQKRLADQLFRSSYAERAQQRAAGHRG